MHLPCLVYMELSRNISEAEVLADKPSDCDSMLARALAPEDVAKGDYVTLLHEYIDVPSFYWCCDAALHAREETVWIRYLPRTGGMPLRVKSVCLPFVLVRHPWGDERALDLRKYRVARLSGQYAARAWKAYKKAKPKNTLVQ
jgi:hypothetical protein